MNQSEVKEIRRRFKSGNNAILRIYGCYVNANKEIISTFEASPGLMQEEEEEMYLKLLKKVLSGGLEKNLLDMEFSTEQVESSPEHKLLMDARDAELKDESIREQLCRKIIENFTLDESNYLILMAYDAYDVSYMDKNDEEVFDGGGEMFGYYICAICPVKDSKLALRYNNTNGKFDSSATGQIAGNPEAGFMFPAFNDRSSDIYHAMYYVRDAADLHDELLEALFGGEKPVSAPEQRFIFSSAMETALEGELSLEVVQSMHEQMRDAIEIHKEAKDPEPLGIPMDEAVDFMHGSGVSKEKIEEFEKACEKQLGEDAVIRPQNIIDPKKFEISTSEVQIKVSPEASFLIETKVIDGRRYILIPADAGLEVNGIEVNIPIEE